MRLQGLIDIARSLFFGHRSTFGFVILPFVGVVLFLVLPFVEVGSGNTF